MIRPTLLAGCAVLFVNGCARTIPRTESMYFQTVLTAPPQMWINGEPVEPNKSNFARLWGSPDHTVKVEGGQVCIWNDWSGPDWDCAVGFDESGKYRPMDPNVDYGFCLSCTYDLRGSTPKQCPQCGRPVWSKR